MDQAVSNTISDLQNCIFHPKKKISFVQVNEISTQPNSSIFQCSDCFKQDLQFKGANYMLIQNLIEDSDSEFNYKWPPLNDQQIVQKIHLKAKNLNSTETIINQINSYYSQLKDEIIKKIDIFQKKAINQALEMPFGQEQILKKYQEISQIKNLKSLILQDQNKSFDLYQKSCKDFIQQIQLQKDKNTQLLNDLLNQCDKVQELVNFDRLNDSKLLILDFLDSLNFFEEQTQSQASQINNQTNIELPQRDNNKINLLMQLISNKTNYCSEEFLNQIKQQLQKLSFFFEQISFEKMNQENKKSIRFSELNDERINKINEYVEHLIKIQDNPQYLQSIKNSNKISNLKNILESKFNFITNNYKGSLMEYLTETYPFFQNNLNSDQIHSEEQNFNSLRRLETNYIKDFVKLVNRKQFFEENQQNFVNSQTCRVQQQILKLFLIEQNELQNILKQFPVFDLIEFKEGISILDQLFFQKSNLKDGNQRLEITKNLNNQYEITINQAYYIGSYRSSNTNCISQILESNKKYKFRIQFKKGNRGYFRIGLMQNKNFNTIEGFYDNMSYQFEQKNNKINYITGTGIDKFVKGDSQQQLDENTTLELRVWIDGQQLQVLDYPQMNYQVEIKDEFKLNLLQKDLCLYLGLFADQDKCILQEAFIVEQF